MRGVRVCLVDDHCVLAQALAARLQAEPDIVVVGVACDREAARRVVGVERPAVLVLDLVLGEDNGVESLPVLLKERPDLRVVMLSGYDDDEAVLAAIRAGASAWVPKTAGGDELLSAIRAVAAGGAWFPPTLLARVLARLAHPPAPSPEIQRASALTTREREVLQCLVDGLGRKQIAGELYLSENTVRAHTQNLLGKLNAHSRSEAVAVALRIGMRPAGRRT